MHRIGRGNRSAAVGDAFTLMSPEEQPHVAAIEQFMGRTVPRVMLPDFDYRMRPAEISQVVSYPEGGNRPVGAPPIRAAHASARAAAPARHARLAREKKPAARGRRRK